MYSPRIKEHQLKRLQILKKKSNIPMTRIVEMAIEEYLQKIADTENNGGLTQPISLEVVLPTRTRKRPQKGN